MSGSVGGARGPAARGYGLHVGVPGPAPARCIGALLRVQQQGVRNRLDWVGEGKERGASAKGGRAGGTRRTALTPPLDKVGLPLLQFGGSGGGGLGISICLRRQIGRGRGTARLRAGCCGRSSGCCLPPLLHLGRDRLAVTSASVSRK